MNSSLLFLCSFSALLQVYYLGLFYPLTEFPYRTINLVCQFVINL